MKSILLKLLLTVVLLVFGFKLSLYPQEDLFRSLEGYTWVVTSVAFSPDGFMLASGSDDNTIKLWRIYQSSNSIENEIINNKNRNNKYYS